MPEVEAAASSRELTSSDGTEHVFCPSGITSGSGIGGVVSSGSSLRGGVDGVSPGSSAAGTSHVTPDSTISGATFVLGVSVTPAILSDGATPASEFPVSCLSFGTENNLGNGTKETN